MTRKKHLIFVGIMSLLFAVLALIPTFLLDIIPLKEGHYVVILIVILFLMLFYYRKLNYTNASFRKLIITGSAIVFLGMCLNFIMERVHLSVIGEDGIQEIIDRKVDKRIKKFEGKNLDMFKIENSISDDIRPPILETIAFSLFGSLGLFLLVFIFSLILRTDKKPRDINITDQQSIS